MAVGCRRLAARVGSRAPASESRGELVTRSGLSHPVGKRHHRQNWNNGFGGKHLKVWKGLCWWQSGPQTLEEEALSGAFKSGREPGVRRGYTPALEV